MHILFFIHEVSIKSQFNNICDLCKLAKCNKIKKTTTKTLKKQKKPKKKNHNNNDITLTSICYNKLSKI